MPGNNRNILVIQKRLFLWCRRREQRLSAAEICCMVITDPVTPERRTAEMSKSWPGSETAALLKAHQNNKWQSYLYMFINKNVSPCLPAENTRGADLRCLTRNERVKGEGNNEALWCQRWGVLQAQWGTELLAEGDWIRYNCPVVLWN